jgi:predicted 2-oxoglutarate/Fe(II)-dependent dioxygenase YbiX
MSHEVCDSIIAEYKDDKWLQSTTIDEKDNFRTCKQVETWKTEGGDQNTRKELDKIIFETIHPIITAYSKDFGKIHTFLPIQEDTGYTILKYEKNNRYKEHIDTLPSAEYDFNGNIKTIFKQRKITLILALNDNYQGGGVSFFGNTYKPEVRKGDALLFPSWNMFPHQVLPIKKGVRYSIITWCV